MTLYGHRRAERNHTAVAIDENRRELGDCLTGTTSDDHEATLRRFLELAPNAPAAAVVRERLAQR